MHREGELFAHARPGVCAHLATNPVIDQQSDDAIGERRRFAGRDEVSGFSVAHEFRTPLTAIKASATSLLSGALDAQQQNELLTVINEESDRMNHLVEEATGEPLSPAHLARELDDS